MDSRNFDGLRFGPDINLGSLHIELRKLPAGRGDLNSGKLGVLRFVNFAGGGAKAKSCDSKPADESCGFHAGIPLSSQTAFC